MCLYVINSRDYRKYGKGILFNDGCALNETASIVFELCDGFHTIDSIIQYFYDHYICNNIDNDVEDCIEQLLALKKIRLCE
jgi:hypothetical protein